MAKMKKEDLVDLLERILAGVRADDSFEGSFRYSAMEDGLAPGEFEVSCAVRTGNSVGQGGIILVSPSEDGTSDEES